jgi:ParB-like nuclease domain
VYDELQTTRPAADQVRVNGQSVNGHANGGRAVPEGKAKRSELWPATTVPISTLLPADSPRFGELDLDHAQSLADVDAELPPILVRRVSMRVIDGMHRLNAAKLRGHDDILVQFFDGDENEAFLLAVESNVTHGLPLKVAERRAAAARIIRSHPEMSDRSVAAIAGLAAKTVASIRNGAEDFPQVSARVGRDGRVRPLNSAGGRRIAGMMFTNQPHASLRKIAKEAGISVGTARDVRERILRGEDPTLPCHPPKSQDDTAGGPHSSAAIARRSAELIDHHAVLENLQRDPSLRYSDAGRSLLRWLGQRAIGTADWESVAANIPPHCAIVVARIARSCSVAWTDFAEALDQRVRTAT